MAKATAGHLIGVAAAVVILILGVAELAVSSGSAVVHPESGLRLMVIEGQAYPTLRILLPDQIEPCRGIEVEFPEHVWGRHRDTMEAEQLYLRLSGRPGQVEPTPPEYEWRADDVALSYEMNLREAVIMKAEARLESDGVRFLYEFTNLSGVDYQELQPVTCVQMRSVFHDLYLERTYVYHDWGFDLMASETPLRLRLPRGEWLPCRYLVPYTWPIKPPDERVELRDDGVTVYHKSCRVAAPLLVTLSQDGRWLAATYTEHSGNIWSNPKLTCHHADPSVELAPGGIKRLVLKTYVIQGSFDELLGRIAEDFGSARGQAAPPN
jgi:hypothetical protein